MEGGRQGREIEGEGETYRRQGEIGRESDRERESERDRERERERRERGTDGRTDGRMDGRTDRQTEIEDGEKEEGKRQLGWECVMHYLLGVHMYLSVFRTAMINESEFFQYYVLQF